MRWRFGWVGWIVVVILVSTMASRGALGKGQEERRPRCREAGIAPGILSPGPRNAITDVPGVRVGSVTVWEGDDVRTGVTVILPHEGNLFQEKVPAGVEVGNGFGKAVGFLQIQELGVIETPIALTNTLNVGLVADALVTWTLQQPGNEEVRSVNPVVGETNDGYLSAIEKRAVRPEHVFEAIRRASESVEEGSVGAGTGTRCLGFKGGIGTASRLLPENRGGWIVGALVQTNFGGILTIDGVPVGRELGRYYMKEDVENDPDLGSSPETGRGGSCMIVVATDAPLSPRQLHRMAKRALLGIARVGGFMSNGSGDFVIAFSTARENRVAYRSDEAVRTVKELRDDRLSPIFLATVEAVEEAILNSLFKATDVCGREGRCVNALPVDRVVDIWNRYRPGAAGRD
jgi:D-aminopeptidase